MYDEVKREIARYYTNLLPVKIYFIWYYAIMQVHSVCIVKDWGFIIIFNNS